MQVPKKFFQYFSNIYIYIYIYIYLRLCKSKTVEVVVLVCTEVDVLPRFKK